MQGGELPGVPDDGDDGESIVCHVDMDCFYAACERLKAPELEGEPVVVGMGYEPGEGHGAVATASYEAREYGVESAQAITTALERLPRMADAREDSDVDESDAGYYRPVDMEYYQAVGAEVKEVLHDVADIVREVSIDEAYLDVTDRTAWEVAEGFGRHVKDRIDREVGVTASVGVAPNMSAAKLASDHDKPDGLVVVPPAELQDFLDPIPIDDLHGIGPVTAGELREWGIESIGDLADAEAAEVAERFGERGRELHRRARGVDDRVVTPMGRPKSLSNESAFPDAVEATDPKVEKVRALATKVADRARRKEAMYRTIGIKVVTPPFDVNTRERSLPGPVDDPPLVEEVALELLSEFHDDRVRKLGVRVSNLSFAEGDQADLSSWGSEDARTDAVSANATDPGTTERILTGRVSDSSETDSVERGDVSLTDYEADTDGTVGEAGRLRRPPAGQTRQTVLREFR